MRVSSSHDNAGFFDDNIMVTAKVEPISDPPEPFGAFLSTSVDPKYFKTRDKIRTIRNNRTTYNNKIFSPQEPLPHVINGPIFTIDPNNKQLRRITPEELEQIKGFPLGWTNCLKEFERYKCL